MHKDKTICLNMIVKNEAHIIEKTLNNLCSFIHFDYWVIVDTGSTDNTKQIISDFFNNLNIKGELLDCEWKNFGFNRTFALKNAFNKTDYLLIFDADDYINGDFKLPDPFDADGYHLKFGNNFSYIRLLLINNRLNWEFVGVLHEFIVCRNPNYSCKLKDIDGNYFLESGRSGARSTNPNKYLDDAKILEKGFYEAVEKNDDIKVRYSFYCAQSYKDANHHTEAIEWYKKRIDFKEWNQEVYYSYLMIGNIYHSLNQIENAIYYWTLSYNADPERCEGLYNVIKFYREKGFFLLALSFYKLIDNNRDRDLTHKLFVTEDIYKYKLDYEFSIIASYTSQHKQAIQSFHRLFHNFNEHINIRINIIENLIFYINHIDYTRDNLQFFYDFLNYVQSIYIESGNLKDSIINIFNALYDKFKPHLIFYDREKIDLLYHKKNIITNDSNNNIILTVTTCKRFDLFEQTMNSFINNCSDIDKITYFFCVDDNSSDDDRNKMKNSYPFFDFYFKNEDEKGHRDSMNIIWDKLNSLQPTFWLHLEDDWLFIHKTNLIQKSIDFLNKYQNDNIHQILFNKNYGEIFNHFNLLGGKPIENNQFKLHIKDEKNLNGQNCAYWAHYSFRPSMIRAHTIIKLENFDSINNFFEMDYANKYTNAGYKSAFFNNILCIHIGKLTSQRGNDFSNAYSLNKTNQFNYNNLDNDKKIISNFLNTDIATIFPFKKYNDSNLFILNLAKRVDRKEYMINTLHNNSFNSSDYQIFTAIDGYSLEGSELIFKLFEGNDFGYRCGFIGCALSHLSIWNLLIHDNNHDYYIIFEDDITFCSDFKMKYDSVINFIHNNKNFDFLFFGYSMYNHVRENNKNIYNVEVDINNIQFNNLDVNNFIGGIFGYIISKKGVHKMFQYIVDNRIKHGIDYLIKINNNLECLETRPNFIFTDWVHHNDSTVDSDIQKNYKSINFSNINVNFDNYKFYLGLDHSGDDLKHMGNSSLFELIHYSNKNKNCVGFNTLGFFKKFIHIHNLSETPWIHKNNKQGIYIKKSFIEKFLKDESYHSYNKNIKTIKIKMLCNWCSSEKLCNDIIPLNKDKYRWNNIEVTWSNNIEEIDYYVIFNKTTEYFDPNRTIIFQMEPWCYDPNSTWGVKTWGEWAEPDENKFLQVRSHKNFYNNCFWQLSITYNQFKYDLVDLTKKYDHISSICSSKYFDIGHIKRIDFIKFIESKNDDIVKIDIYNHDNLHNFKGYKGPHPPNNKDIGIIPYKYYFMCENNEEYNFITEKIWEPLLTETLCFYWGCPNLSDYINPLAYVLLDMNDFEKSFAIIKNAIKNDLWSQRIQYIREEKQKVLDYYSFFPTIERVLFKDFLLPLSYVDNTFLYYHKYFYNYFKKENSKEKNVLFIHSCFIHNIDILNYLLKYVQKNIHKIDKIYINNIGKELDRNLINSDILKKIVDKLVIFNFSDNINLFEIPTLKIISIYSKFNPDANILYLHTKGISYNQNYIHFIFDWIHLMLYSLVDNMSYCLDILNDNIYKTIGSNYQSSPHHHYSGNFWWAKASYIHRLDIQTNQLKDKHDAEWWLLSDNNFNISEHFIAFLSNMNHYSSLFPKNLYDNFKISSYRELKLIDNIKKYQCSAWLGHLEFVVWLIKTINKIHNIHTIVELGVDFGHSSFALSSPNIGKVYSIDCFEGDCMTGFRDSYNIFINKKKDLIDNKLLITDNIVLIRDYFDNVFDNFEKYINMSIDILHIDGLHAYESVKNDFEKWSHFCDYNSIILFHDICSFPNTVGRYFDEIDGSIYYKIKMTHSAGLGILSKNKDFIDIILNHWILKLKEISLNNKTVLHHIDLDLYINK